MGAVVPSGLGSQFAEALFVLKIEVSFESIECLLSDRLVAPFVDSRGKDTGFSKTASVRRIAALLMMGSSVAVAYPWQSRRRSQTSSMGISGFQSADRRLLFCSMSSGVTCP
jgi:hypothetical protein